MSAVQASRLDSTLSVDCSKLRKIGLYTLYIIIQSSKAELISKTAKFNILVTDNGEKSAFVPGTGARNVYLPRG
jgi:hypothetical protein